MITLFVTMNAANVGCLICVNNNLTTFITFHRPIQYKVHSLFVTPNTPKFLSHSYYVYLWANPHPSFFSAYLQYLHWYVYSNLWPNEGKWLLADLLLAYPEHSRTQNLPSSCQFPIYPHVHWSSWYQCKGYSNYISGQSGIISYYEHQYFISLYYEYLFLAESRMCLLGRMGKACILGHLLMAVFVVEDLSRLPTILAILCACFYIRYFLFIRYPMFLG